MHAQSDPNWKTLYLVGGIASLLTIVFYLAEMIALGGAEYPADMAAWYVLFARSRLLGLFYLNALDIVSITLQAPFFLALAAALWRVDRSWALLAGGAALLGVAVFVAPRSTSIATLALSEQYAAAETAAVRAQLIAAGEGLHAQLQATPHTVGFALLAVAALIVCARMPWPRKVCPLALMGLAAGALTLLGDVLLVVWPAAANPAMIAGGVCWLAWWGMAGAWLIGQSRQPNTRLGW